MLADLPRAVSARLAPSLKLVSLELGDVIDKLGEHNRYAYFPTTAVISMTCVMANGETAETGMIGREGMTALALCLGVAGAPSHAVTQVAGDALRISVRSLKLELDRNGALRDLLLRYIYTLFVQISQSVGCNTHHPIGARLSRWLLIVRDRVSSDELLLRHDFLSTMLGTQRSAVTIAAGLLRKAGLIRYSRGKITILSRRGLEAHACECYRAVKRAHDRAGLP